MQNVHVYMCENHHVYWRSDILWELITISLSPPVIKIDLMAFTHTLQEEFEDIKGVITTCKSKDRQHNGQKKKDKQRSTKHTI
jgi:hypothetical protein